MSPHLVVLRDRARSDIDEAVTHRLGEAGPGAALTLIDRIQTALAHLAEHPEAGSPRFAHELGLPGLRCWGVEEEAYLIFYRPDPRAVDVWRVLHTRKNLPEWLVEEG